MDTSRFFITGLPRSRTAWLAAFLTTARTMCYHEPSVKMQRLEDIGDLYDHPGHEYTHVGISDSALGFWAESVLEMYEPRTLVVIRNVNDVKESLADLGVPGGELCDELVSRLMPLHRDPLVLCVPFSALDDERVIQNVWFHLLPGVPFDVTRWREFAKLNIQRKPPSKTRTIHEEISLARG